jgi:Rrf2 family iron-sulfur cluster assembly transcriptional regulator
MKITREADYALRIVAMLAGETKQVEAKAIAEKKRVPYRFTLKILRKLVQSGLVKSYRGVNGGYALNRGANEITFKDVIEAIDGSIAINACIEQPRICENANDCNIQRQLLLAQNVFAKELDSISFDQILQEER